MDRSSDDRQKSSKRSRHDRNTTKDQHKHEHSIQRHRLTQCNEDEGRSKRERSRKQEGSRERRRIEDDGDNDNDNGGGSIEKVATPESSIMASRNTCDSLPTKVSSIENKEVTNINVYHEVPGNFSTDHETASASAAVKISQNLSLEAIAKARKFLERQKGLKLEEMLKKVMSNKGSRAASLDAHSGPVMPLGRPTKAPVLRVDALGREINEHGNVVNVTKRNNLSTLKVNINKQKRDAFQIIEPVLEVNPEENPHFDARMGINKNKLLRPKRMTFQFVEEGKWSREGEIIRLKNQFGEAGAIEQKAKQAQLAKAKAAPDINPNLIPLSERVLVTKEKPKEEIPDTEWWDVPLLRSGSYSELADNATISEDKLNMERISLYAEHPRPIEPPAEPAPPPPQPLKLTKKEKKKLRTQHRLAREKDKQEMIRQGLIEPPKPKIKMSNLMKVLVSEATQDPTKLEMEVRSAAAEREQAHIDRNIARKLTPAERREKKKRKLFADPNTVETIVSVYRINELSHKKNRFKVDVNARENLLTGCAVISEGIAVVIVEGGTKSIKRYGKLMLERINWEKESEEKDEVDDMDEDRTPNKCVLVWQGSVAKPNFRRFSTHECMTEAVAKKVFADAGVAHYWDLAVNFVKG